MSATNFWPRATKYDVHVLPLDFPGTLSNTARALINETLVLTDMLRANQNTEHCWQSQITALTTQRLKTAFLSLSTHLNDKDSKLALEWRAQTFDDQNAKKELSEKIAQMDEKELVCYSGAMSTWVGKSKELFYSTFYATPNENLQYVSNVVDKNIDEAVLTLRKNINAELKCLPFCGYKIVDLFASSGEANLYPKHFAYFMPEDEGVKYAGSKRTIVFANVYSALFENISTQRLAFYGWDSSDLPSNNDLSTYLIAWFRGHDLGHSIVTPTTSFRALSKCDRWGSMVLQEALADIFGLLICTTSSIVNELNLNKEKLARVYLLEMLRYLRRGPCDFPDAGAAYVQLKFFVESGCLKLNSNGEIRADLTGFYPAVLRLAGHLTENILQGNIESAELFMRSYCPHHDVENCTSIMANLGVITDTIEYEQRIREV